MFLPPLNDILENAKVVALPLVGEFRGLTTRTAILFEGPSGWAEFAPFKNHDVAHSSNWLAAAIEQAYGQWPAAAASEVLVNGILPTLDIDGSVKAVESLCRNYGISTIKFKCSDDFDLDLQKIHSVTGCLKSLGVEPKIRFDVNANWDLTTAIQNLKRLSAVADVVEYVEQPVAALDDLQRLKSEVDIPIALDESLRLASPGSLDFDVINRIADVVILKAIPLGGVQSALKLADSITKPIVVSGSLDTSVGLAAGLQLAALLPPHTAGLATDLLFGVSLTSIPHVIKDGRIQVGRRNPDLANEFLASETETVDLQERLIAAYEYLANLQTLENA